MRYLESRDTGSSKIILFFLEASVSSVHLPNPKSCLNQSQFGTSVEWCHFGCQRTLGFVKNSCSPSVALSCPTLCNPMDCSPLGFSVLHYRLEFTRTVEPFYLQDAERKQKGKSLGCSLRILTFLVFASLQALEGLCWVSRLNLKPQQMLRNDKGPWQDPLESDLLVSSDTEDMQVLYCCSFHPGLLRGVGWHGKVAAPAKIL